MSLVPINIDQLQDIERFSRNNNFKNQSPYDIMTTLCKEYGHKIYNLKKHKFFRSYFIEDKFQSSNIKSFDEEYEEISNLKTASKLLNNTDNKILKKLNIESKILDNSIDSYEEDFNKSRSHKQLSIVSDIKNSNYYNLFLKLKNGITIPLFIGLNNQEKTVSLYITNSFEAEENCGYITLYNSTTKFKKNYAYINWVTPYYNCNTQKNKVSGKETVKIFINICKLANIQRVDLEDASSLPCFDDPILNDLKLYKLIEKGKSWYESLGFYPSPESKIRINSKNNFPQVKYRNINIKSDHYTSYLKKYKHHTNVIRTFNINIFIDLLQEIDNNFEKIIKKKNVDIEQLMNMKSFGYLISSQNTKKQLLKDFLPKLYKQNCAYYHYFIDLLTDNEMLYSIMLVLGPKYKHFTKIAGLLESFRFLDDVTYYFQVL